MKRNPGVECFRVLLMLGICYLHAITLPAQWHHVVVGQANARLAYLLASCVPGFLFISGWYGIRLRVSKFISLWSQAFYCTVIIVLLSFLASEASPFVSVASILRNNWFLNGYCVMMLLAPLVDLAVEQSPRALLGLLALVFGWAFLAEAPKIGSLCIPRSAGIESYSGICCLGIYAFARLVRKFCLFKYLNSRRAWAIIAGSVAFIVATHLSHYASIFPSLLSAVCFWWFSRRNWCADSFSSKVILYLGPSMFAVFLFHNSALGAEAITLAMRWLMEMGVAEIFAAPMVAVAVFAAGVVLDLPRRLIIMQVRRLKT